MHMQAASSVEQSVAFLVASSRHFREHSGKKSSLFCATAQLAKALAREKKDDLMMSLEIDMPNVDTLFWAGVASS
jgi:hypothetical protein